MALAVIWWHSGRPGQHPTIWRSMFSTCTGTHVQHFPFQMPDPAFQTNGGEAFGCSLGPIPTCPKPRDYLASLAPGRASRGRLHPEQPTIADP